MNSPFLTIAEVAKRLSVSAEAVYRLKDQGRIGHHMIGGAIRISEAQLAEFLGDVEQHPKPLKNHPRAGCPTPPRHDR